MIGIKTVKILIFFHAKTAKKKRQDRKELKS
jgi:hypothetical protein